MKGPVSGESGVGTHSGSFHASVAVFCVAILTRSGFQAAGLDRRFGGSLQFQVVDLDRCFDGPLQFANSDEGTVFRQPE